MEEKEINKIMDNITEDKNLCIIRSALEDTSKEVLNRCLELLDEQQKAELYESFNGGTFDTDSFNEWTDNLMEVF